MLRIPLPVVNIDRCTFIRPDIEKVLYVFLLRYLRKNESAGKTIDLTMTMTMTLLYAIARAASMYMWMSA